MTTQQHPTTPEVDPGRLDRLVRQLQAHGFTLRQMQDGDALVWFICRWNRADAAATIDDVERFAGRLNSR